MAELLRKVQPDQWFQNKDGTKPSENILFRFIIYMHGQN